MRRLPRSPVPTIAALTLTAVVFMGTSGRSTATSGPNVHEKQSQGNAAGSGQGDGRGGDVAAGRTLYVKGCSSCHGDDGRGVTVGGEVRGPSLRSSGEAMAYFQLATGRMPLTDSGDTPQRKRSPYTDEQIDDLVAYVSSLSGGRGARLPTVDVATGILAEGGETYRANCAACHGAAGTGGALSYGRSAPNIHPATPDEIGAAVRAGPGQMPVFGDDTLSPADLDSLVRYVEYLDNPTDAGGLPLARVGPIPEGFVAWVIGVGFLLVCVMWIGTWMRKQNHESA